MEELDRDLDCATKQLNEAESESKNFESSYKLEKGLQKEEMLQKWNEAARDAHKWRSICWTLRMKKKRFFDAFKVHVEDSSKL